MSIINYEPQRVFHYFQEIAEIPHGSGNTKMISDHIMQTADKLGLPAEQDRLGNVVIRKPGTPGYEASDTVILQGHMDMVCEKDADCVRDMEKEGLKLQLLQRKDLPWLTGDKEEASDRRKADDPILKAEGTTLGGDDGIAVAYMLAILESTEIEHPPLECVFTVDEEIGMLGAVGMDMSNLTGKYLLNIDSEEEGHVLVGCAGGCLTTIRVPVERELPEEETGQENAGDREESAPSYARSMRLTVTGLLGGHSGMEIHKGRANANMLLGRVLQELRKELPGDFRLVSVDGGSKDNAIPREAAAEVWISGDKTERAKEVVEKTEAVIQREYGSCDPEIRISLEDETSGTDEPGPDGQKQKTPELKAGSFTDVSAEKVISLLRCLPNGIQKMNPVIPELVETSLNLGILRTERDSVSASFCVRSGVNSEKEELNSRIEALAQVLGGTVQIEGQYPAWEMRETSRLRDIMCKCYHEQTGEKMIVETIHAGVECGLFSDGVPGLDAVSFGPDMTDIHTPKEAMDIYSVERTWKLILAVLKELK